MAPQIATASNDLIYEQAPVLRSKWSTATLAFAALAVAPIDAVIAQVEAGTVAEVQRPSTWASAGLAAIQRLPANWDGYGADPIPPDVIARMAEILDAEVPANGVTGSIVPGADGSLQTEWHLEHVQLGVVVETDGSVSAWVRSPHDDVEVERFGLEARMLLAEVANAALA